MVAPWCHCSETYLCVQENKYKFFTGMMPLWLFALGRFYLDPNAVKVPYLNIFLPLLPIVIPMAVGLVIRRFLPKIADKIAWFARPWSVVVIIYALCFGMYVNWYMYEIMGSQAAKVIPPSILLPTLGYVIALGVAVLARRNWKQAVAISIETGIQNSSIPIIILQGSFPQPEGDVAAVMPVATSLFFSSPLILAWVVYIIWKRICTDSKNGDAKIADEEKEQDDTKRTDSGTFESVLDNSTEVTGIWKAHIFFPINDLFDDGPHFPQITFVGIFLIYGIYFLLSSKWKISLFLYSLYF